VRNNGFDSTVGSANSGGGGGGGSRNNSFNFPGRNGGSGLVVLRQLV
jgi:hypothetical protein